MHAQICECLICVTVFIPAEICIVCIPGSSVPLSLRRGLLLLTYEIDVEGTRTEK